MKDSFLGLWQSPDRKKVIRIIGKRSESDSSNEQGRKKKKREIGKGSVNEEAALVWQQNLSWVCAVVSAEQGKAIFVACTSFIASRRSVLVPFSLLGFFNSFLYIYILFCLYAPLYR